MPPVKCKINFLIVSVWKLIRVKVGTYGCQADDKWTVLILLGVNLIKPEILFHEFQSLCDSRLELAMR